MTITTRRKCIKQRQSMHATSESAINAELIQVYGTVQGVGFRPFVWRLAHQYHLRGRVWNDAEGVMIQVWGGAPSLSEFRQQLQTEIPPLANIESIVSTPLFDENIPTDFSIVDSQPGKTLTNVSADARTCPQCLAEIFDPTSRRYRYAFTNCTHCGPRFSIIKAIPYDRDHTSMQSFRMCPECQAEYDNPANRRFHAQPNACRSCGPSVWLENAAMERVSVSGFIDDIAYATHLIQQGRILAIKGIGGFHLVCDARNADTVRKLRRRKHRYHKPFALMAGKINIIRRYAHISIEEENLLQDSAAPIVILSIQENGKLPDEIAPGQLRLGFMLPYSPLHSLLLNGLDFPVVMTSGNRSDEAPCITNEQARQQLAGIADFFLFHNREIVNRLDDSVARVVNKKTQLLRRARGYAPRPLKLPPGFETSPSILSMGAELKNTFCLIKEGKAILSQHQGDLEDASVFHSYQDNIRLYRQLFAVQASVIAIDKHPEYISSKYGLQLAAAEDINVIRVQHHHAHIATCMAEHGLPRQTQAVLGIALDGLGYGDDGELWGGEFLLADYVHSKRIACFQPIAMPGGSRAMIEPWRNAIAHLQENRGWREVANEYPDWAFVKLMQDKPVENLLLMIKNGINSPPASSAGRLFDAVAAVLGICTAAVSYEGQAAMQVEAIAEAVWESSRLYSSKLSEPDHNGLLTIQWHELWQGILTDINSNIPVRVIAARFQQTLLSMITEVIDFLSTQYDFSHVVLSGGVMQNRLLLQGLIEALGNSRYEVLTAGQVPANDGGIAFGQAVIAAAHCIGGSGAQQAQQDGCDERY